MDSTEPQGEMGWWDRSQELEDAEEQFAEEARIRHQYFPHLHPGVTPRDPDEIIRPSYQGPHTLPARRQEAVSPHEEKEQSF